MVSMWTLHLVVRVVHVNVASKHDLQGLKPSRCPKRATHFRRRGVLATVEPIRGTS